MAQQSIVTKVGTAVAIGVVATLIVQSLLTRLPNLQAVVLGRQPQADS